MPIAVRYPFIQRFPVSARKAYEWCTAFDAGDHVLMGEEGAERLVTQLTKDTIILTDTFQTISGQVEKQKLVQLFPNLLFWTSTHLTGPNKYSQFLYAISAESKGASSLSFTALHLEYGKEDLDEASVALIAEKLRKEDAYCWKRLAEAMTKELCK